jgi:aldose 1-epimerase
MNTRPVSGTDHRLESHGYVAHIASIGASLRSLTFQGRDLVLPYDIDEVRPRYRGTVLAPWPNRVIDGRYDWDGESHQLAHTEPERGHALHGLALWLDFALLASSDTAVTLGATIEPQAGYPWRVGVEARYEIGAHGLRTRLEATNLSSAAIPLGLGPHPYLVAGDGPVDDWTLELPADTVVEVTEERLLPVGERAVEGSEFDFRTARRIGATALDHAFTDLSRDAAGTATVRVTSGDTGVELSWGEDSPWLQVHTADLPDPSETRRGLAVEPMSCAPDAFRSHPNEVRLPAGAARAISWTIAATEAPPAGI